MIDIQYTVMFDLLTCDWISSALPTRMQKSPEVLTDIKLLKYLTNFSLFLVSQKTTQYASLSGLMYAYTSVLEQYPHC